MTSASSVLSASSTPSPFAALKDTEERKARVRQIVDQARGIATEVGFPADFASLVSHLESELEVSEDTAIALLEEIGEQPEPEQKEADLPVREGGHEGLDRLLAAIQALPDDEAAEDVPTEDVLAAPLPKSENPRPHIDLEALDRRLGRTRSR